MINVFNLVKLNKTELNFNHKNKNSDEIKNSILKFFEYVCPFIPNGILVFFSNYIYMNKIYLYFK